MSSVPSNAPGGAELADGEDSLSFCWRQFSAQFKSEKESVEELCRILHAGGLSCRYCKSRDVLREHGARTIKCLNCMTESWFTAGTFFHGIRLARPWVAAIWLIEHGVGVSASKFHKLLGIAYSSAWSILRKLAMVVQRQMGEEFVSSVRFVALLCRRSRETPAREHPSAEEKMEDKLCDEMRAGQIAGSIDSSSALSANDSFAGVSSGCPASQNKSDTAGQAEPNRQEPSSLRELGDMEKQVYEILSPIEAVQFDSLCEYAGMPAGALSAALMMLELSDLVRSLPGDRYVRCSPDVEVASSEDFVPDSILKAVAAIIDYVRLRFQGISRKYLQNYLALHWCQVDRMRWGPGMLFMECLKSRAIRLEEILSYVSPPLVYITSRFF